MTEATHHVPHAAGAKVGGKPLIIWIGVPALAFVGYKWYKAKQNPTAAATATGVDYAPVASGYSTTDPNTGGGYYSDGTASVPSAGSTVLTDSSWSAQAATWAIVQGYNAADVYNALDSYFHGGTLSATQSGVIQAILVRFGPPPGAGILPVNIGTTQTAPSTTPSPSSDPVATTSTGVTTVNTSQSQPPTSGDGPGTEWHWDGSQWVLVPSPVVHGEPSHTTTVAATQSLSAYVDGFGYPTGSSKAATMAAIKAANPGAIDSKGNIKAGVNLTIPVWNEVTKKYQ